MSDKENDGRHEAEMEIRAQLASEISTRAAARLFDVSHSTIARIKQQANPVGEDGTVAVRLVQGLDGKQRPNRRLDTSERDALIVSLFRSGSSTRNIAVEAECSVGTVHRIVKAHKNSAAGGPGSGSTSGTSQENE